MRTSDTLQEFAGAMANVQAELKPALMNATNPFLKNRYADLGSVVDAVQKLATKHGLSTIQMPFSADGVIGVTTRIIHKSGEWVEGDLAFPLVEERGKSLAQAAGGLITYIRRYALASAFGVVSDEDSDGNAPQQAQQAQPKKQTAEPAQKKQEPPPAQLAPLPERNTTHKAALVEKSKPTVGDVVAALFGDGVSQPPDSLAAIQAQYSGKSITPATVVKPETALAMYDFVANK